MKVAVVTSVDRWSGKYWELTVEEASTPRSAIGLRVYSERGDGVGVYYSITEDGDVRKYDVSASIRGGDFSVDISDGGELTADEKWYIVGARNSVMDWLPSHAPDLALIPAIDFREVRKPKG